METYNLTLEQAMLVGMRESKGVRRSVLAKLKGLESKPISAPVGPAKPMLPTEIEAQAEAMLRLSNNEQFKKQFPLIWQDLSDGLQNGLRAGMGITSLPAPAGSDRPLDVNELAKRAGIAIPKNYRSAVGAYVSKRCQSVEVERIINGSIRICKAYADHGSATQAIMDYAALKGFA